MLPLWDIITIILRGLLQYILFWIPVVKPLQESWNPPSWWYAFWGWGDWRYNLDSDRRPNQTFIEKYLFAGWGWLKKLAVHEAQEFTQVVRNFLVALIGPIFYGFRSVTAWLNNVDLKVGWVLPSWAASAAAGLWRLYHWLPTEIREWGWQWWQVWDKNVDRAVAVARGLFAEAIGWAWTAVTWVWNTGDHLRTWWLTVSAFVWWLWMDFYGAIMSKLGHAWWWLVDFRNNARAWVIGWLAPWWEPLMTFTRDCLWFYYNLWGACAADLGEFLTNPLDFLWDQGEAFLNRKLE